MQPFQLLDHMRCDFLYTTALSNTLAVDNFICYKSVCADKVFGRRGKLLSKAFFQAAVLPLEYRCVGHNQLPDIWKVYPVIFADERQRSIVSKKAEGKRIFLLLLLFLIQPIVPDRRAEHRADSIGVTGRGQIGEVDAGKGVVAFDAHFPGAGDENRLGGILDTYGIYAHLADSDLGRLAATIDDRFETLLKNKPE